MAKFNIVKIFEHKSLLIVINLCIQLTLSLELYLYT